MVWDTSRRALAEFVGSFTLIFISAGAVIYNDLAAAGIAAGVAMAVMVTAIAHISGGHVNPAITLAHLVTRRIHPIHAVAYWIVQFGGAALAALLLKWVLPASTSPYGAPTLNSQAGIDAGKGVAIEATITFFLVWVFFACMADPRGIYDRIAGLLVGAAVTMGVLSAFPLTGSAMNPARAFGPELVANDWKDWWVWYVGPLAGAVLAAVIYEALYLRDVPAAGPPGEYEYEDEDEDEESEPSADEPAAPSEWPAEPPRPGTDPPPPGTAAAP